MKFSLLRFKKAEKWLETLCWITYSIQLVVKKDEGGDIVLKPEKKPQYKFSDGKCATYRFCFAY